MKKFLLTLAVVLFCLSRSFGQETESTPFDATFRFVFHSVLEGLYEDGVSNEDVDQILLRKEKDKGAYIHFIYSCPICMPALHALLTYRERPVGVFAKYKHTGYQMQEHTFGNGLTKDEKALLHSPNIKERLTLVNSLVSRWVGRRTKLTGGNTIGLEAGREQGMRSLKSFREEGSLDSFAPGYKDDDVEECAICNGALGMKFKTKKGK